MEKLVRIVFLDRGTMGPSFELAKPSFAHEWIEHDRTDREDIVDRLRGAQIAVTNKVGIG
jgi:glycerate dehydrogenase